MGRADTADAASDGSIIPLDHFEILREAREIVGEEARGLMEVASRLDDTFCTAVDLLFRCPSAVIVTGMGKAGLIGRKIAATLCSTGTSAHFLHPAEAVHGDLGCLSSNGVLIVLSNSGETEEIIRLLPAVRALGVDVLAVTASHGSTLGKAASVTIALGRLSEAGLHGLAPSTSTTAMLAVGDALALVLARRKGWTAEHFGRLHAGGALGARLKTVGEIMRRDDSLRIAHDGQTVRAVFARSARPGRRTGAVILINAEGRISGLFTDSDLARLLERRDDGRLDRPICEVMTCRPFTITPEARIADAIETLSRNRISELPVVDDQRRPIGIVDITDVVGLSPAVAEEDLRSSHASPQPSRALPA